MEEGNLRDPDRLDINQNLVSLGQTYGNIDHLKIMQQQKTWIGNCFFDTVYFKDLCDVPWFHCPAMLRNVKEKPLILVTLNIWIKVGIYVFTMNASTDKIIYTNTSNDLIWIIFNPYKRYKTKHSRDLTLTSLTCKL